MHPVHFLLGNVAYTLVNIPEWMRHSKLIDDHFRRGNVFALEDRTKVLTVISAATWKMATTIDTYKKVTVDAPPATPEVDVQFYRNKLREISASAKAALGE